MLFRCLLAFIVSVEMSAVVLLFWWVFPFILKNSSWDILIVLAFHQLYYNVPSVDLKVFFSTWSSQPLNQSFVVFISHYLFKFCFCFPFSSSMSIYMLNLLTIYNISFTQSSIFNQNYIHIMGSDLVLAIYDLLH